ncbi:DNA repair protein RadC [Gemella sp. zg-570]|uniref:RadC family protein n=1 Tax=Gemella sp. zg-570 TaxID=2840371 RepID=UPI001C0E81F3|nr:DNA repair protein RadC [Gemella sp. zg-570]QWQ38719.1 DNA repair protein RadC [Gemella sp. zg-570]
MVNNIKIKDLDCEDRPREKLKKYGASNLSDKELLAILLRTGTQKLNVIELAEKILKDIGGINNLRYATFNELQKHKGIGQVKAINILAGLEFAKRIFTEDISEEVACDNPQVVANYFRHKLSTLKQEVFIAVDLNTKGKILEEREVFKGSLSSSLIHPREIFKNSVRNSAASIICLHNHPSGDASPSREDIKTTYNLIEVGEILGISCLDHIIIAKKGYCSLIKVLNILAKEKISLENLSSEILERILKQYNLVESYT